MRSSLFVTTCVASLFAASACAPIALDGAAQADAADDGGVAPVIGSDGGAGASFGDAGAMAPGGGTPGFRPACGDVTTCNPDDLGACGTSGLAVDGGAAEAGPPPDAGASGLVDASAALSPDAATTDGGAVVGTLACVPFASGRASACLAAGEARAGGVCAGPADCAPGTACVLARCMPTCCARATACPTGTACTLTATTGSSAPWLPVCAPLQPCAFDTALDLGPSDAGRRCPDGTQCGFVSEEGVRACVPLGRAREGEPCAAEPCAGGLACVGSGSLERCARLCTTDGTRGCPAGMRCRAHAALFGTADVGYCAPAR